MTGKKLKLGLGESAANKAFLAKLATITIGTGTKAPAPSCPDCGGKMKLVGVGMALVRVRKPARDTSEEQSFAM